MTERKVVSTVCEDYPCCGHGPPPLGDNGGCPVRYDDGTERWKCCLCGVLMEENATSSVCEPCLRRSSEDDLDPYEEP